MLASQIVFWLCAALIVWTQLGYALVLFAVARVVAPAAACHAIASRGARPGAQPIIGLARRFACRRRSR